MLKRQKAHFAGDGAGDEACLGLVPSHWRCNRRATKLELDLESEIQAAVRPGAFSATPEAGQRIANLAAALERESQVSWRDGDLENLNGTWDLLYTSNAEVDQADLRQLIPGLDDPPLERVQQEIDVQAGRLRNVLFVAPWPKLEALDLQDAQVVLSLDHRLEAYGSARLRIVLERLDRRLQNRQGGQVQ
ncbi:unnamed protein product, partial [Effrenium voratum]